MSKRKIQEDVQESLIPHKDCKLGLFFVIWFVFDEKKNDM
jgi:hypothetical protein